MNDFLARLKQRKLVQWALAYVAFAFALLQGIDIVAQQFGWPEGARRGITLALAVGFFVVLVLAWYHGERGAQKVGGTELLIIALLLAIGGTLVWRFGPAAVGRLGHSMTPGADSAAAIRPGPTGSATVADFALSASTAGIPEKSVAVLPFVNESGDKGQQYFSDGLSEDLINALSQFSGLKVIARNSAFQFRDSKDSSARIGRLLGVAHLLEGSVQRAGGDVRITATLVNASDGSVVWSQRYDKPYKDLFALQDDITRAVAVALQAKLLAGSSADAQSDRPPSGSLAAYNEYLQGAFYLARFTEADQRKAIGFFENAIRLDRNYALAWARIANAWAALAGNFLGGADAAQAWDKARASVHAALTLNPDLAAAHSVNSFILSAADHDWKGAETEAHRAYQLAPNKQFHSLANIRATLGETQQAVDLIHDGLPSDPLCSGCYSGLAFYLPSLGHPDEAAQAARKSLQLNPNFHFIREQLVYIEAMRGDAAAALREAQQQPPGAWREVSLAVALQIGPDRMAADAALRAAIDKQAGNAAYQIAEVYALRKQPDQMFAWLERANRNRDPGIVELLYDVPVLRYRNDPRFAAFCRKVGLPTITHAVGMR